MSMALFKTKLDKSVARAVAYIQSQGFCETQEGDGELRVTVDTTFDMIELAKIVLNVYHEGDKA